MMEERKERAPGRSDKTAIKTTRADAKAAIPAFIENWPVRGTEFVQPESCVRSCGSTISLSVHEKESGKSLFTSWSRDGS